MGRSRCGARQRAFWRAVAAYRPVGTRAWSSENQSALRGPAPARPAPGASSGRRSTLSPLTTQLCRQSTAVGRYRIRSLNGARPAPCRQPPSRTGSTDVVTFSVAGIGPELLSWPRPIDENPGVLAQPVVELLNGRIDQAVDRTQRLVGLAGDLLHAGELRLGRPRLDAADRPRE